MAYRYLTDETILPTEVIKLICEFTGPREKWVRRAKDETVNFDLYYFMKFDGFILSEEDEKKQLLKVRRQHPLFALSHIRKLTNSMIKIKNIEVEDIEEYERTKMYMIYLKKELMGVEEEEILSLFGETLVFPV